MEPDCLGSNVDPRAVLLQAHHFAFLIYKTDIIYPLCGLPQELNELLDAGLTFVPST